MRGNPSQSKATLLLSLDYVDGKRAHGVRAGRRSRCYAVAWSPLKKISTLTLVLRSLKPISWAYPQRGLTLYLTTVTIESISSIMIIMLVYFFCTIFLFVCSIKCIVGGTYACRRCILCCRQIEKVCRKSKQTYYKICIVSIATIVR